MVETLLKEAVNLFGYHHVAYALKEGRRYIEGRIHGTWQSNDLKACAVYCSMKDNRDEMLRIISRGENG